MYLEGKTNDFPSFRIGKGDAVAISDSPVDVVGDEGRVDAEGEPLAGEEEEDVEEDVQDVLGQDEGVERVALVDRVLVVRLQLVERDDLKEFEFLGF